MVFLCPEGGGFHDSSPIPTQRHGFFYIRTWCVDGHYFLRGHRGAKRCVRVSAEIPGQWSALWANHQGMHRQGKAQRYRRRPGIPHLPHHETLKRHKKLSSEVGFKGIFKKVLIFALVGIGHILDTRVIGSGSVMRTAVIFFYLSNEGVSLLENAAYLGLPIPQKLKSVLEQLHDRSEKENE